MAMGRVKGIFALSKIDVISGLMVDFLRLIDVNAAGLRLKKGQEILHLTLCWEIGSSYWYRLESIFPFFFVAPPPLGPCDVSWRNKQNHSYR